VGFLPFGILSAAGAGGVVAADAYELISTTILTSNTASVTFSNLGDYSSTYKHLQIRAAVRSTRTGDGDAFFLRFNGDSGNNYTFHSVAGNGSSVASAAGTAENRGYLADGHSAGSTANGFAGLVTDILEPYSISKNKTVKTLTGWNSTSRQVALRSALWLNTSSITSVNLFALNGNLVAGCRFSLYGIKG
jgi:hypothetical protein